MSPTATATSPRPQPDELTFVVDKRCLTASSPEAKPSSGRPGAVARMLTAAFGTTIVYWNCTPWPSLEHAGYRRATSIVDLCGQAGVLIVCLAYVPGETDGIIGRNDVGALATGSVIGAEEHHLPIPGSRAARRTSGPAGYATRPPRSDDDRAERGRPDRLGRECGGGHGEVDAGGGGVLVGDGPAPTPPARATSRTASTTSARRLASMSSTSAVSSAVRHMLAVNRSHRVSATGRGRARPCGTRACDRRWSSLRMQSTKAWRSAHHDARISRPRSRWSRHTSSCSKPVLDTERATGRRGR